MSKATPILNLPDWVPAPPASLADALAETDRLKAEALALGKAGRDARWHGYPSGRDRQAPDVRERFRLAQEAHETALAAVKRSERAAAHVALTDGQEWRVRVQEAIARKARAIEEVVVAEVAHEFADIDVARGIVSQLGNAECLQGNLASFVVPEQVPPPPLEFSGRLGSALVASADLWRLLGAVVEHARALAPEDRSAGRGAMSERLAEIAANA